MPGAWIYKLNQNNLGLRLREDGAALDPHPR
ncbi:Uncharacterised protein [Achromobacter xylosoxidans]|nr:Uncharacterised protein [Achromobacter xylosoxidans]CUJ25438.1 Uncharacterised protein [Achromobacter xylosoxidans]CUR79848.1 hypothetical protein BN2910_31570 [Achromobacter xylosoxidans]